MAVLFLRQQFSFLCCLLLIILFTSQASADNNAQNFHFFCDFNSRGNYTANSTYQTNLDTLLSTITSNTEIDYGFYNFSCGENNDKVNAIGLCRGDIKPDECRNCLIKSKANLTQVCPNQKEAIGWYEDEKCMLRYSDRSIFSLDETGPAYFAWSMQNAMSGNEFNEAVEKLLERIKSKAASSSDSGIKYATESAPGPDSNTTIYGLAQCTPDLSDPECNNCLNQSIVEVPNCCSNRIGARIVRPSCNLRFEISPFYGELPTADSPSQSPTPPPSSFPVPPPKSPTPLPSSFPVPPPNSLMIYNTSSDSEGKSNTSGTAVAMVPLLLLLLCSFLSVSSIKES